MLRNPTPAKKSHQRTLSKVENKSQKQLPKHRSTKSYTFSSASEKKLTNQKHSLSRNSSSQTTERKSDSKKKLLIHKKTSSLTDKPLSQILSNLQKKNSSLPAKRDSVISKCSFRSNTGYIPGNPQKVNQDNFILNQAISTETSLFSVADGHGINGEHVSSYIKNRFPQLLSKSPYLLSSTNRAIFTSCLKLNKEIFHKDFDTNFSGSTLVSVLVRHKKIWCANIGDSRALLGRQLNDNLNRPSNHWVSIALSRDHKPCEVDESNRIYANGGRVEAYQDEHGNPFGPSRVWLKNQNIPGLAMSRSFGDRVANSVGVIAEPEILELDLTPEDKFIVIGSDGIFEFLHNEDIVKIVVPFWKKGDSEAAAEALAKEARNAWMREEEVIDDITCVIVFLNVKS